MNRYAVTFSVLGHLGVLALVTVLAARGVPPSVLETAMPVQMVMDVTSTDLTEPQIHTLEAHTLETHTSEPQKASMTKQPAGQTQPAMSESMPVAKKIGAGEKITTETQENKTAEEVTETAAGQRPLSQQSGAGPASAGRIGETTDLGRLSQHLQRHLVYPQAARRLQQQGQVWLHLYLDQQNQPVSVHIQGSSDYPLLDREAVAVVRRSQPLPDLPNLIGKKVTVPVQFILQAETD